MRLRSFVVSILILLVAVLFLFPARTYAYLDPGTGSYILQLALATIVGALFAVRLFWGRIKSFFQRLSSKQVQDEQNEE